MYMKYVIETTYKYVKKPYCSKVFLPGPFFFYPSAQPLWILMPETKIWARWHTKMQWSHQSQKNSWSCFCCNKLSKVPKIISPPMLPSRLCQQTILNLWTMSLGFLKTRFISKILNWKIPSVDTSFGHFAQNWPFFGHFWTFLPK